MTLLPEVETLSQHLFSAMSWSTTTNEGFKSTSISPLGPGLFAGGVILAGVAVAAPNVYSKGGIPGTTVRRKK
jgi:hypothetical protein